MADAQHIQWLLEGVEAWNARREAGGDLYEEIPDFSGVNLRVAFENAGQIKGDEWIPLAGYELSGADLTLSVLNRADLTRANLAIADLTDVDLTGADLTGANLANANLANADLTGADLTGADLTGADLTGADLVRANLVRADLIRANLTIADLTGANLTDARILSANFTGTVCTNANFKGAMLVSVECIDAEFSGANFIESNLTGTELWRAKIYSVGKSPARIQITRRFVKSVENLLNIVKRIQSHHSYSGDDFCMYFRGERQTGWKLQPSIMRDSNLRLHENMMLIDLIAQRPEEFNELASGLARFVTAQHHGLRTRFLDVSSNPLIALFYACAGAIRRRNGRLHIFVVPRNIVKSFTSDTVSVVANYARLPIDHQMALIGNYDATSDPYYIYNVAMEQLHQLIQSEKPYFVQRIDPRDFYRVIIVEPQQTSERIRAQSGAFLVSAFHKRFEMDEILKQNADIPVYAHYQLIVPAGRKSAILDELKMLKVTYETLFPGPDASAKAITEIYLAR